MRRTRVLKFGSIAAAVAAVSMWMLPAWGQTGAASRMPPAMTSTRSGAGLTRQLAAARLATAKYATNLGRAKAAGYMVITPVMPNMGVHFLNPKIGGFDIRKPQILVYEKHGSKWQLGALEWVFTTMPRTPPLRDATFGLFPAACHFKDGTFVPDRSSSTCPKKNPKTGAVFTFWHPDLITMHVWIWYPNPSGLYSSTNPLVAPFNGG
jgi:hypothetical protein